LFNNAAEDSKMPELAATELRLLNADLEYSRRTLAKLRLEELPSAPCDRGSPLLFKKSELEYLASILNAEEQKALLLPMTIEITPEVDRVLLEGSLEIEGKILSRILKTPITIFEGKLLFYKSQLVELRKYLKTTIQYRFMSKGDKMPDSGF
jgi:uncharacterized protein